VAAFRDEELSQLDWSLLRDGAITCYRDPEQFELDLKWLADHGYTIIRIDCAHPDVFRATMSQALRFRELYGYEWTGNPDALNDAARDIDFERPTGVVLGLTALDKLHAIEPDLAVNVLDILACSSREHSLLGDRLIGLVHTSGLRLVFPKLGGLVPGWI